MSLSCVVRQPVLAGALQQAARAVGSDRAPLALIKNILLSVDGDGGLLRVGATDMTNSVQAWVPIQVQEPGMFTVPAKLLTEYVAQLPPDDVSLQLTGTTLVVRCGRSVARFKGVGGEDFPHLPEPPEDGWLVDTAILRAAGARVAPYAGAAQGHPILGGISVTGGPGGLRFQGSDSFSWADESFACAVDPFEIIMTRPGLRLLAECLPLNTESMVSLLPDTDYPVHLCVQVEDLFVTTRLMEGRYPDMTRLLPAAFTSRATVRRAALLAEVRRMLPLGGIQKGILEHVKLRCSITGEALAVSVLGEEIGSADGLIAAQVEGAPLRFVIDAGLLANFLGDLPGDVVTLAANPNSPVFLTDPSLPQYRGMCMPMSDAWLSEEPGDSQEDSAA